MYQVLDHIFPDEMHEIIRKGFRKGQQWENVQQQDALDTILLGQMLQVGSCSCELDFLCLIE